MEMEPWLQTLLTILGTILASSGFWAYIQERSKRKAAENKHNNLETQMKILAGQTKSYVDGKVGSASDIQSGDTVKTFSKDYKTVTTVYANGNQLVKTFSDDMKTITSVLTDSEGTVIATETKTLSDDGLTISTDVVYG